MAIRTVNEEMNEEIVQSNESFETLRCGAY